MKVWRLAGPATMCALGLSVSACGGDSGGVKSTPAPTPSPTPAGTFPLSTDSTFQSGISSRIFFTDAKSGSVQMDSAGVTGRGNDVTIAYNAGTSAYTLVDSRSYTTGYSDGSTKTFSGSTIVFKPAAKISSVGYTDVYKTSSAGSSDTLTLFGNANGSAGGTPPIQLSYLSYALWSHTDTATTQTRQTYVLFGTPSALSAIPTTGSATYKTYVAADALTLDSGKNNVGVTQNLSGTADFNVDFGAGTVGTGLSLASTSDGSSFGTYVGNGKIIGGGQFTGTFTSSLPTFNSGAFMGGFYGPTAQEMGYTFYVFNNSSPAKGPVVSTYINGVVVGTK